MLSRAGVVCVLVVAVLGDALCGVASAQAPTVPLPSDVKIDLPAAGIPASVSQFAGAWANGAWDGVLPHVLVVESVDGIGRAQVVYAGGDSAEADASRGYRCRASVSGTVAGTTVRIPMTESGPGSKRITLEATVYRPGGDGPRAGRSLDGRRGRFPAAIESRYSSVQYARPCRWNPRPEVAASRWDACWPPPVWPGRDWTVSDSALLLGRALRARHASGWCVSSAANSVGFTGLVMW